MFQFRRSVPSVTWLACLLSSLALSSHHLQPQSFYTHQRGSGKDAVFSSATSRRAFRGRSLDPSYIIPDPMTNQTKLASVFWRNPSPNNRKEGNSNNNNNNRGNGSPPFNHCRSQASDSITSQRMLGAIVPRQQRRVPGPIGFARKSKCVKGRSLWSLAT